MVCYAGAGCLSLLPAYGDRLQLSHVERLCGNWPWTDDGAGRPYCSPQACAGTLRGAAGVHIHRQPADPRYDANFWLCAATLDEDVRIQGQENAYKEVVKTAVGGAAGVIHAVDTAVTDCQPNENIEALRVFMLSKRVECRPLWKPMHKQPVYEGAPVYTNGIEEQLFKVGFCLPAGPCVTDDDVRYIVESIKEAIV